MRLPRSVSDRAQCSIAWSILALALACGGTPPEAASGWRIEQRPLVDAVLVSGEIRTGDATELLAPMLGMWPIPIETIVEDGAAVVEGQPVAEFDNSLAAGDLSRRRQALDDARTRVLTTQSRLAAEEADARFEVESKSLQLDKARLEASVPAELLSELEAQDRQLTLRRAELELAAARTSLESQLQKARAEVGIAQVEADKARTELDRTEQSLEVAVLRAPRDGIVEIAYNREEGRPYRSGDNAQPGLPVIRFPDYASLRVEAFLFDVDQGTVEPGASAKVALDAYPEQTFHGVLTDIQEVAQQPSGRSSRRVFRLLVSLDAPDPELMRVGMSAKVAIESSIDEWNGQPTLVAPRAAIRFAQAKERNDAGGLEAMIKTRSDGQRAVLVGRCSLEHCIVATAGGEQPLRTDDELLPWSGSESLGASP